MAEPLYTITRRMYLTLQASRGLTGSSLVNWFVAEEGASTALEYPDWDMNERKTWTEWEAEYHR
jgi:hypothetical protein